MSFADTIKSLPPVDHLAALKVLDANGAVVATVENKPGKAASLTIFHALAQRHGGAITPAAAVEGLSLYGEHVADAQANPGKHPNIERLMAWAAGSVSYRVELVPAA